MYQRLYPSPCPYLTADRRTYDDLCVTNTLTEMLKTERGQRIMAKRSGALQLQQRWMEESLQLSMSASGQHSFPQSKPTFFPKTLLVPLILFLIFILFYLENSAMEMFKLLGVQKVAIYKTSCYPDTQKVLDYYVRQGFVDIIPWTVSSYIKVAKGWKKSTSPGELEFFGQIVALNDCVYRYMYESHYVALQDLDEFILPLKEDNWLTLIPYLEKIYQHHAGFEFENNVFPISLSSNKKPENTPDLWKQFKGENILPHVYRIPNDPNVFNNFKVIVNPRLAFKATVHGILDSASGTVRVDPKIARMYHVKSYPSKNFSPKSVIRDTRLWDYADKLIPAVSEVLRQALNIQ
ncbi:hypothetical protein SRHO_G00083350 [Serrasalmus rhombeus]